MKAPLKTDWEAVSEIVPDADLSVTRNWFAALDLDRLQTICPLTFQEYAYCLIRGLKAKRVVELSTTAISTALIHAAMKAEGDGELVTCDGKFRTQAEASYRIALATGYKLESDWIYRSSLAGVVAPWDVFVCNWPESADTLAAGWEWLRIGGVLVANEFDDVFFEFLGARDYYVVGSAAVVWNGV